MFQNGPIRKNTLRGGGSEAGFSLIELLVVAVLLALMSSILYGTISSIMRGRALIQDEQQSARVAQYVLERISRELSSRVPVSLSPREGERDQTTQTANPYFAARAESLEGIDGQTGSNDADRLRFTSLNAGQVFFSAVPNYGLVEIEYRLEEPRRRGGVRSSRKEEQTGRVLVREERPADVRTEKAVKERRFAFPMAENVESLNFRYRKDGEWLNEWKDQSARVPEAIEVTLSLLGEEGRAEKYRTAVFISAAQRSQR